MRQHSDLFRFHFRSVTTPQTAVEESEGLRRITPLGPPRKCVRPDPLPDPVDGFLLGKTHIVIDRDTKFLPFRDFLEHDTDMEPVLTPPRSPNCNAHIKRFMLSLKSKCLNRMIFFGEASLRKALVQFEEHYTHRTKPSG